jgi:hypothetical protein
MRHPRGTSARFVLAVLAIGVAVMLGPAAAALAEPPAPARGPAIITPFKSSVLLAVPSADSGFTGNNIVETEAVATTAAIAAGTLWIFRGRQTARDRELDREDRKEALEALAGAVAGVEGTVRARKLLPGADTDIQTMRDTLNALELLQVRAEPFAKPDTLQRFRDLAGRLLTPDSASEDGTDAENRLFQAVAGSLRSEIRPSPSQSSGAAPSTPPASSR